MKKIKCEMCDSIDFVKQDGMFVCQECGMKYSVEEARKLMIEVDDLNAPVAPVKAIVETPFVAPVVNNESVLENYLTNARRAFKNGDYEEAERYFNKAEECSAKCIEAVIYSTLSKAKISLGVNDSKSRTVIFNVLVNSIKGIEESYNESERDFYKNFLSKFVLDLKMLFSSTYVYNKWYDYNTKTYKNNSGETVLLFLSIYDSLVNLVNILIAKDRQYYMYSLVETVSEPLISLSSEKTKKIINDNKQVYTTKLINHYWEEHKEDRQEIDEKIKENNAKIEELNKAINNLHETHVLNEVINKITKLKSEAAQLGVFKIKEKKEYKSKIELAEVELNEALEAQKKATAGCEAEISKLNNEIFVTQRLINGRPITEAKVFIK